MTMELPGHPKYTRTCPKWDVPRQDSIVADAEANGWCLTNVSDTWVHVGNSMSKERVLTFRRAA